MIEPAGIGTQGDALGEGHTPVGVVVFPGVFGAGIMGDAGGRVEKTV